MSSDDHDDTLLLRDRGEGDNASAHLHAADSGLAIPDALVGKVIAEHYEILEVIGRGGMGAVYKARHQMIRRVVAIKMLHPHLIGVGNTVARFKQEAETIARLHHPNLVQWHNFGITAEGAPFIVMDYVEGSLLASAFASQKQMPVPRLLSIFEQMCDAVGYAHAQGVVHRDLKPSNVILVCNEDGTESVKVLDFGIAKFAGESEMKGVTKTGETLGSPQYMSPEQCSGTNMDARSDIYSLGCLLYEALAGRPRVTGDTVFESMYQHMKEEPRPFAAERKDISNAQEFEELVFRCLEKNPDARFQNMAQVKDALTEAAASAVAGHKGKLARRLRTQTSKLKRHRKLAIAAALVAVLIGGSAGYGFMYVKDALTTTKETAAIMSSFRWPRLASDGAIGDQQDLTQRLMVAKILAAPMEKMGNSALKRLERAETFADYHRQAGSYKLAIKEYDKIMQYKLAGPATQDVMAWRSLYQRGVCRYNLGQYDEAAKDFQYVLNKAGAFRNNELAEDISKPMSKLADVYYQRGDYKEALERFLRSLGFLEKQGPLLLAMAATKEPTSAIAHKDPFDLPRVYCKIADCYANLGEPNKAIGFYRHALAFWDKFDMPVEKAMTRYRLALALGKDKEAGELFENAAEHLREARQPADKEAAMVLHDYALYKIDVQHDPLAALNLMSQSKRLFKRAAVAEES